MTRGRTGQVEADAASESRYEEGKDLVVVVELIAERQAWHSASDGCLERGSPGRTLLGRRGAVETAVLIGVVYATGESGSTKPSMPRQRTLVHPVLDRVEEAPAPREDQDLVLVLVPGAQQVAKNLCLLKPTFATHRCTGTHGPLPTQRLVLLGREAGHAVPVVDGKGELGEPGVRVEFARIALQVCAIYHLVRRAA